jgi:hypothetical protein
MWPEMVEILEIISVCLPLTLPPVTGALEPKLDSRLIGWQTYARCSQSSLPVQTARIHRQCRYAAEDNHPRDNDEPLLDAAFMDRCIDDPKRFLADDASFRRKGRQFICPPGVQSIGCQDQRRRERTGVR